MSKSTASLGTVIKDRRRKPNKDDEESDKDKHPTWNAYLASSHTTLEALYATRDSLNSAIQRIEMLNSELHLLSLQLTRYMDISLPAVQLVRTWSASPELRGDSIGDIKRRVPAFPATGRFTQTHIDDLQAIQEYVLGEVEELVRRQEPMVWDMRMVLNDAVRNHGVR